MGWEPIETAPKDGTWILTIQKNFGGHWMVPWPARRSAGWNVGIDHHREQSAYFQPAYWMSMPTPPKE